MLTGNPQQRYLNAGNCPDSTNSPFFANISAQPAPPMPIVSPSSFRPNLFIRNRHFQTLFANSVQSGPKVTYRRQRIDTPDGDFLDLDWSETSSDSLLILGHGLIGSSTKWYMKMFSAAANRSGLDALAMNFRSCSGEPNRKKTFYHCAATWDVNTVVECALSAGRYRRIFLLGFSFGGGLFANYIEKCGMHLPSELCKAAGISVPLDLRESALLVHRISNYPYERRFLKKLQQKLLDKEFRMPGTFDLAKLDRIRSLVEFDNIYTAPIHGFSGSDELYEKTSPKDAVAGIRIPFLLINAKNDPILGPESYPEIAAVRNRNLFLEIPGSGGHLGFISMRKGWLENRVMNWFLSE